MPLVGCSSPASILSVVVLPAPFGPRKPTTSPRSTVKLTPATARTSPRAPVHQRGERRLHPALALGHDVGLAQVRTSMSAIRAHHDGRGSERVGRRHRPGIMAHPHSSAAPVARCRIWFGGWTSPWPPLDDGARARRAGRGRPGRAGRAAAAGRAGAAGGRAGAAGTRAGSGPTPRRCTRRCWRAGVAVGRVQDLRLCHAVLARSARTSTRPAGRTTSAGARSTRLSAAATASPACSTCRRPGGCPDLARGGRRAPAPAGGGGGRGRARDRLRLLLAAESAGALVAAELTARRAALRRGRARRACSPGCWARGRCPAGGRPGWRRSRSRSGRCCGAPGLNPDSRAGPAAGAAHPGPDRRHHPAVGAGAARPPRRRPAAGVQEAGPAARAPTAGAGWRPGCATAGSAPSTCPPASSPAGGPPAAAARCSCPSRCGPPSSPLPGDGWWWPTRPSWSRGCWRRWPRDEAMARASRAGDLYQALVDEGVVGHPGARQGGHARRPLRRDLGRGRPADAAAAAQLPARPPATWRRRPARGSAARW